MIRHQNLCRHANGCHALAAAHEGTCKQKEPTAAFAAWAPNEGDSSCRILYSPSCAHTENSIESGFVVAGTVMPEIHIADVFQAESNQ